MRLILIASRYDTNVESGTKRKADVEHFIGTVGHCLQRCCRKQGWCLHIPYALHRNGARQRIEAGIKVRNGWCDCREKSLVLLELQYQPFGHVGVLLRACVEAHQIAVRHARVVGEEISTA